MKQSSSILPHAGLLTLAGIIVYMGAITEESSSKAKSKEDIIPFSFNYGPSLMLALISFVGCQLSGVACINYYISMRSQATKNVKKTQQSKKNAKENESSFGPFPRRFVGREKLKMSQKGSEGIYVNLAVDGSGDLILYDDAKQNYYEARSDKHVRESIGEMKSQKLISKTFSSPVMNLSRRERIESNQNIDLKKKPPIGFLLNNRAADAAHNDINEKPLLLEKCYNKKFEPEKIFLDPKEEMKGINTFKVLEDRYKAKKERKERRSFEKRERKKERESETYVGAEHRAAEWHRSSRTDNPSSYKPPFERLSRSNLQQMNTDFHSNMQANRHANMHANVQKNHRSDFNGDISSILECPFSEQLSPSQSEEEEGAMKGLSLLDLRRHHGLLLSCTSLGLLFSPHSQATQQSFTRYSHNFESQQNPQKSQFSKFQQHADTAEEMQQFQKFEPQRLVESMPVHRKFDKKKNTVFYKASNDRSQTHILTDFESSPFSNKTNLRRTISNDFTPSSAMHRVVYVRNPSAHFKASSFDKSSSPELAAFSNEDAAIFACSDYLIRKKKITHV